MKYILIIVALMMLWATSASAQSYPSTAWVEECSKSEKVIGENIHTCRAYIHGIINALAIWQYVSPETALVCFPSGADFGKIREQILPQVRRQARKDISASMLLTRILSENLPCRQQGA